MAIHRYSTRLIAIVHSHVQNYPDNGVIDLSNDVAEFSSNKSIKGVGTAFLRLVPRRNYFNIIFPNDIINIYIDPNDGKSGFVRVFMGYIDRIDRAESVNQDTGATTTSFSVVCSDFMKAIDKTEIYFNPHLANREDFIDARFGKSSLAGNALRTRGIVVQGSPADMVENLLLLLLGFGAQWVLPQCYPSGFAEDSRKRRIQRSKKRISSNIRAQLETLGFTVDSLQPGQDLEKAFIDISLRAQGSIEEFEPGRSATARDGQQIRQKVIAKLLADNSALSAYATIVREASSTELSILDLLEFSFIEAMAVDGFTADASVWWTQQSSLASLMYGYCNEIVNELCFDLRPVVSDGIQGDPCFGTEYSRAPDELGINSDGSTRFDSNLQAGVAAIKYVPSVIFREYPFSVVNRLDLSNFYILGDTSLGKIPFGPIFSTGPESPGRHLYSYTDEGITSLAPEACLFESISAPMKHLDVVTIDDSDIIDARIGRSDHDTFNLFALYSTDMLEKHWKYLTKDFMPIITPVSISRNGLRVFEPSTKFANYSRDPICSTTGSAVDSDHIRRNLVRWALLLDHWNQHNIEYLSGSMSLRGRPDIRVGYRLDRIGRNESYYVEQVDHSWQYGGLFITTVQVSRGQRNDPFPAYIPPIIATNAGRPAFGVGDLGATPGLVPNPIATEGGGNRQADGRLGKHFQISNTPATSNTRDAPHSNIETYGNIIDKAPNADGGKFAKYANTEELDPIDIQEIALIRNGGKK